MTKKITYNILAIVQGDPNVNAGARLRIYNWANDLHNYRKDIRVTLIVKPKKPDELRKKIISWANDSSVSTIKVALVQKNYSIYSIGLLIYLKLKNIAIIQDICDPPIKHFNPSPFTKSFFATQYLGFVTRYLVDGIVTSSSALKRSFDSSNTYVRYIPDCIDNYPAIFQDNPKINDIRNKKITRLNLLWFGGAARRDSDAGIEELYSAIGILNEISQHVEVHLTICTVLQKEHYDKFKTFKDTLLSTTITYIEWSLKSQSQCLNNCDFCFLPRLQSLSTFYKSPNRVILAKLHGKESITNFVTSEDYSNAGMINAGAFIDQMKSGNLYIKSRQTVQDSVPENWRKDSIIESWTQFIDEIAILSSKSSKKPRLNLSKYLLWATYYLIVAMPKLYELKIFLRKIYRRIKYKIQGGPVDLSKE